MSGTPTPGVVVFSYSNWSARYPELASWVLEPLATAFFREATIYLPNTADSKITDLDKREAILNMITAHIAKLNAPIDGEASSQLVGRISNASMGSVSVAVESITPKNATEAWYMSTKYGAAAWAATANMRLFRYMPGQPPDIDPFPHADPYGSFR